MKKILFKVVFTILIIIGISYAYNIEATTSYPLNAKVDLVDGEMQVEFSDGSTKTYDSSVITQVGAENDYNYFVFPKIYLDTNDSYYYYIAEDGYKYILTGWKVSDTYKTYFGYTGSNITYYSSLGNNNGYENMYEPSVNVFQSEDWVDVSKTMQNGVTEITFTPIYGKCIYINDPFENIYYDGNLYLSVLNPDYVSDDSSSANYIKNILGFNTVDEYKEFLYYYTRKNVGTSITGNEAWKKYISFYDSSVTAKGYYYAPSYSKKWTGASDKNDGHDAQNAVATMDRAYELITARKDFSPYHYVFYMLGNVHEVRVYNGSAKPSTNFNYSQGKFLYDATGTYTKAMSTNGSDNNYYGGLTNKYKGVTLTSATNTRYALIKRLSTYSQAWMASIRFDNVEYRNLTINSTEIGNNNFAGKLSFGNEENLFARSSNSHSNIFQVCEFTRKALATGWTTFRTNGAKVITLNGKFSSNPSIHHSWGSSINYLDQTVFNIGGSQNIAYFYTGTMTTNATSIGTVNGNVTINVTGNATIGTIYGGCRMRTFQQTGNREINIRGGKVTGGIYGGGQESILNGDVNINITGGDIKNIYGGGKEYMATVYGNVEIAISNVDITGNVYGGGEYASVIKGKTGSLSLNSNKERVLTEKDKENVEDGGNVNVYIKDATIAGNIYGSGQGMVNSVVKMKNYSNIYYGTEYDEQSVASYVEHVNDMLDNCDDYSNISWWNDPVESPTSNEDGSITSYVYRTISASTPASVGSTQWNFRLALYSLDYYLSVASIENSSITLLGNAVINGNVYGGGNLGIVKNNTEIKVDNNVIVKGSVYGGGDGTSAIANITLYNAYNGVLPRFVAYGTTIRYANTNSATSSDQTNLAKSSVLGTFNWSNDTRLIESTTFNGIYKGSDSYSGMELTEDEKNLLSEFGNKKYVYSSSYEDVGEILGNINVEINGGNVKQLFGGCNKANVSGKIDISVQNGTIGNLYGGNNIGGITNGNIEIKIGSANNSPQIENIYGGGNYANHNSNVSITIDKLSGVMNYLFGGGHDADVNGSTNIQINDGVYNYIFGGGDLGKVTGNTYVNVGDKEKNPMVKVNDIVYGGGRGSDTGEDASSIITVDGSSTVWIVGMNTLINNYGSIKLGSVAGDVNVTFDTYRKNNSTNPYVTMNGIDKATTVSLINSYIALENMGENGEKVGIKNIVNLNVPKGSGLKVTAPGEISGNFNGGGSFYLDSKVSLKVGGNVSGTTELVINPQIALEEDNVDTPLIIKGTKVYAYLIVSGNSNSSNIYCTDDRYKDMIRHTIEDGISYFYMESDIAISERIYQEIVSKKNIEYTEDASTWENTAIVEIYRDGIFTTNMNLTYNFAVDNADKKAYRNINRSLSIKESGLEGKDVLFPEGTRVTMVVTEAGNRKYYKYTATKDVKQLYLKDFVEMENASQSYEEVNNIVDDEATVQQGKTSKSVIYERKETFRFVIDFTYCGIPLPIDTYFAYVNIEDGNVISSALSSLSQNIVELKGSRDYDIVLTSDKTVYVEKDIVKVNAQVNVSRLPIEKEDKFIGKPLIARVTMKDEDGNIFSMPANAKLSVENQNIDFIGGVARIELIDVLSEDEMTKNAVINVDTKSVNEYTIKSGKYQIQFETYVADEQGEKIVNRKYFEIEIVRPEGGTVVAKVENTQSKNKVIKLNYYGDVENPFVKVKLQKRMSNGTYEEVKNSVIEQTINNLEESKEITINADLTGLEAGMYKIVFEVYGHEDVLYSTSAVILDV